MHSRLAVLGLLLIACDGGTASSRDGSPPLEDGSPDSADASSSLDAGSASCTAHDVPTEIEFEHDGEMRSALLAGPSALPEAPLPLVLNFHGFSDSPEQQIDYSEMSSDAEERGFLVAYPRGTGLVKGWNAESCCGEAASNAVDDVGFAEALIDEIAKVSCIDRNRVYATGYSNGGMLSHRLACEKSHLFAGVAPVAGVKGNHECTPTHAIPVLHMHGTADVVVPYIGSLALGFESVDDTMEGWRERLDCDETEPTVFFEEGDTTCVEWSGCEAPLGLCTISGGGHTWPGGGAPLVRGKTTTDLDANQMMLEFLGVF